MLSSKEAKRHRERGRGEESSRMFVMFKQSQMRKQNHPPNKRQYTTESNEKTTTTANKKIANDVNKNIVLIVDYFIRVGLCFICRVCLTMLQCALADAAIQNTLFFIWLKLVSFSRQNARVEHTQKKECMDLARSRRCIYYIIAANMWMALLCVWARSRERAFIYSDSLSHVN